MDADVIIVGGGPAGLSAGLILGRCCRRVLIIDSGLGRNRHAQAMHGFLSRDGITPADFRAQARADVQRYGVRIIEGEVIHAERGRKEGFIVQVSGTADPKPGATTNARGPGTGFIQGRKLLLATGVRDVIPLIDGIDAFYGATVHHCPYCDGWEHRGKRLIACGKGDAALGLAIALRTWSEAVTACTQGETPGRAMRAQAEALRITIREEIIERLEGEGNQLRRAILRSGHAIPREQAEMALECEALFFNTEQMQRSHLPRLLGCSFKGDGGVETTDRQRTGVPGLFLAGDAEKEVQFVISAAAEGAAAAVAINRELQDEDGASQTTVRRASPTSARSRS